MTPASRSTAHRPTSASSSFRCCAFALLLWASAVHGAVFHYVFVDVGLPPANMSAAFDAFHALEVSPMLWTSIGAQDNDIFPGYNSRALNYTLGLAVTTSSGATLKMYNDDATHQEWIQTHVAGKGRGMPTTAFDFADPDAGACTPLPSGQSNSRGVVNHVVLLRTKSSISNTELRSNFTAFRAAVLAGVPGVVSIAGGVQDDEIYEGYSPRNPYERTLGFNVRLESASALQTYATHVEHTTARDTYLIPLVDAGTTGYGSIVLDWQDDHEWKYCPPATESTSPEATTDKSAETGPADVPAPERALLAALIFAAAAAIAGR